MLTTALLLGSVPIGSAQAQEIIINQLDATRTGDWNFRAEGSSNITGTYNGDGTHFAFSGVAATATSTANLPNAGYWSVEMWMPSRSATNNALLTVQQGTASTAYRLNQNDSNARWSGQWVSLGVYNFDAGNADVILDNAGASGGSDNVASMTGAMRFAQIGDGITSFVADSVFGPVGSEGEFYTETAGSWITSGSVPSGTDGIHSGSHRLSNTPGAEAVFSGLPLAAGLYQLDLTWGAGGNRTENALLTIIDAGNVTHQFTIDQTQDPSDININGLMWNQYGTFDFDFAGGASEIRLSSADGSFLSADAVQLTLIPEPSTLVLLGVALGSLALFRRRKS
ncbi:MAG: PEP-CTERM sorting domain-containing protein [Verrucomicrobia bacterium]|nr:PEP-CTERM sorting domain-containing protein [Verrucomicrobiota bacterium]MCH8510018.1 PEP-CTERM sorting domain-containing protein [Kiritimatiellia bacterium]